VYELYVERTTERDLKALPAQVFRRVISHINVLSQNPRPPGCHKITGSKSDWRIRIGDYRVIYEIDDKAKIVRVMRVGHRREIYR
jgi:mRNA interferase RelE/StbE